MRRIHNWNQIQADYDSGKSWREIQTLHKISSSTISKARKNKKFITKRCHSDAVKLYQEVNTKKYYHTVEIKKKISDIRKQHLKDNPGQVPYLLNHYSKGDSYPETYFKDIFEKEGINLSHHKQVGLYQLDFYNDDLKIYIEIDGEQHYVDQRIVKSDIRRTEYLSNLGWSGKRIRWSEYQKMSLEQKKEIVANIKTLINGI